MADEKKSGGGFGCGAILVLVLLVGVTQCDREGSPANEQPGTTAVVSPPTTLGFVVPEVFQNISDWTATETDCDTLQGWFDAADNAHGNQSQLDAMRWLSDLMRRIDSRMSSVGCYG